MSKKNKSAFARLKMQKRNFETISKDNIRLRHENSVMKDGVGELETMYKALVTQLVMQHRTTDVPESYELTLPKTNVKELMDAYRLEAKHTDDGLFLRVVKND